MSQTIYRSAAFTVERLGNNNALVRNEVNEARVPASKSASLFLTVRAHSAASLLVQIALADGLDSWLARWHKRYTDYCMNCRKRPPVFTWSCISTDRGRPM